MKTLYFVLVFSGLAFVFFHFQKSSESGTSKNIQKNISPQNQLDKQVLEAKLRQNVTPKPIQIEDAIKITPVDLLGNLNMQKHPDFVNVEVKYAAHKYFWLRKVVYKAFLEMREAAEKEGIRLKITSAGRSFADQKGIWEAKWKARRKKFGSDKATAENILKYSAMPGMSRHHWGTDIDLNNKNDSYWTTEKGKKEYAWLVKNAPKFGFCQTYTPKNEQRPEGYNEEKWHWSYMPLASQFLQAFKTQISYADIQGFSGANTAEELRTIEKYVLGINPECSH